VVQVGFTESVASLHSHADHFLVENSNVQVYIFVRIWKKREGFKQAICIAIYQRGQLLPERLIAEALKVNSALQTIDLDYNSIGVEGARAIAEAINVNLMLERIDLSGNYYIGHDLRFQIEETLKEIRLRIEMNYRKLIDKMMLRFVYYPILRSLTEV
jgi:hypothetical protein